MSGISGVGGSSSAFEYQNLLKQQDGDSNDSTVAPSKAHRGHHHRHAQSGKSTGSLADAITSATETSGADSSNDGLLALLKGSGGNGTRQNPVYSDNGNRPNGLGSLIDVTR
jgi:hypothetical protein